MTLVSIIIPTYNRCEFLLESIQSILKQTYTDYEIIVVDDGSTDNTHIALSHFIKNDTIRYIYQDNCGEAAARNRGITQARGKYIAFLDSDDLLISRSLSERVEYLDKNPDVGLVQSNFCKFDHLGNDLGYRDTSWFSGWVYPEILLYWFTLIAIDTVMVPRYVFDDIGLFDETLHRAEDLDLWRRIARRYPFGAINQILARIRVHSGNISGDRTVEADSFRVYLTKAFHDDPALTRVFRRRALARMYALTAYNLLGEGTRADMGLARKYTLHSMTLWPFLPHAYFGFAASLLNTKLRKRLAQYSRERRFPVMHRSKPSRD